jgi:hypothetical protein
MRLTRRGEGRSGGPKSKKATLLSLATQAWLSLTPFSRTDSQTALQAPSQRKRGERCAGYHAAE